MGPKQQRNSSRGKEAAPSYAEAASCIRNDTQTLDETTDLPRDHVDEENRRDEELRAARDEELRASVSSSSSSSNTSTYDEPFAPGVSYMDIFVQNPPSANANQQVDASSATNNLQGDTTIPELPIKKRVTGLFNMAKVVQLTRGNINFETAKAFRTQANDPNCELTNQNLEIEDLLQYQEQIDRHYMGQEISPEQNDILAKIFYKKIPANCELETDFKAKTKLDLEKAGTKLDTVFGACYRLRVLLATFRELCR
jgi:hypothetical protein